MTLTSVFPMPAAPLYSTGMRTLLARLVSTSALPTHSRSPLLLTRPLVRVRTLLPQALSSAAALRGVHPTHGRAEGPSPTPPRCERVPRPLCAATAPDGTATLRPARARGSGQEFQAQAEKRNFSRREERNFSYV